MYLSHPLHQTPVTYFGTQIPLPLMKTKTNFLASDLFAYIILAFMVVSCMLYFLSVLSLIEFCVLFILIFTVSLLTLVYVKSKLS